MAKLEFVGICEICRSSYPSDSSEKALALAEKCEEMGKPEAKYKPGTEFMLGNGELLTILDRTPTVVRAGNRHEVMYLVQCLGCVSGAWISQGYLETLD